MTAEDIIYKLYEFYKVNNNLELAELLKTTPQTISNWKTRNSISAIKKKCRELRIYNEIFNSITVENEKHTYKYENLCAKGVTAEWLLDNDKSHINQTEIIEEVKFNDIFESILNFYNVSTIRDLSEKINISESTVSKWNQRKSISALKKVCRKLGIYNKIFKNTNKEDLKIEVLEKSLFNDNINKALEIINTMTKDNKELENKFDQFLKDFVKNNL